MFRRLDYENLEQGNLKPKVKFFKTVNEYDPKMEERFKNMHFVY